MSKNRRIELRVSEEEFLQIDKNAKSAKMSRSKFLIQAALNQKLVIVGSTELKNLTSELRRIGINVNQITTLCNIGKISCVHIEDTNKEITKIWKAIESLRKDIKKELRRTRCD